MCVCIYMYIAETKILYTHKYTDSFVSLEILSSTNDLLVPHCEFDSYPIYLYS